MSLGLHTFFVLNILVLMVPLWVIVLMLQLVFIHKVF